jgi:GTPase
VAGGSCGNLKLEIENLKSHARAGLIAVVGRANVGKSTLLNTIIGEKVSIVSPVAQTTRSLIRAILTEPRGQLAFLDTPGVHKASYDLGRMMNRVARAAIEGVDSILLVVDASAAPREEDEGWIRRLTHHASPCVVALNKADKSATHAEDFRRIWQEVCEEKTSAKTATWWTISGLTGNGVEPLVSHLFEIVPEGPQLFPEDVLTDHPRKLAIADVVREKYFQLLRDELPHELAVEIDTIDEKEERWEARGTIFVGKHSQKGIVIGNKGRLLKKVRESAEKNLAEMFGRPVSLELWVKEEKNWNRNYFFLKRLGYAV